jgi:hypothetical protein
VQRVEKEGGEYRREAARAQAISVDMRVSRL